MNISHLNFYINEQIYKEVGWIAIDEVPLWNAEVQAVRTKRLSFNRSRWVDLLFGPHFAHKIHPVEASFQSIDAPKWKYIADLIEHWNQFPKIFFRK